MAEPTSTQLRALFTGFDTGTGKPFNISLLITMNGGVLTYVIRSVTHPEHQRVISTECAGCIEFLSEIMECADQLSIAAS